MAAETPLVSVVIPTRNEMRYIEGCLSSLAEQDYPADRLEVLVIDGGSEDGSRHWLETAATKTTPRMNLLDNPRHTTACGLNTGIRHAKGDVIIILGAHSEVAPDFVSQSVRALQETAADCVGGPIESVGRGLVGDTIAAAISSPFGVGNARFRYSQQAGYVDTVAFGAYRRDVFDRVGLFDEQLRRDVDDEFNYRLASAGGKLWLTPAIRSRYHARASFRSLFGQYWQYGRWKVEVAKRHPKQIRLRHVIPAVFLASLAASVALTLLHPSGKWLLGLTAGIYGGSSLAASAQVARSRGWRLFPLLPLAFACLHFGYGLGSWWGMLRRPGADSRSNNHDGD